MRRAACLLLLVLPGRAQETRDEKADWTVLLYMTADNDLEQCAVDDLARLMAAPQSDRVKVVVQVDRAEEDEPTDDANYSGDEVAKLGNFKGAKRLLVRKDDLKELEDLGETNTGDPKVLEEFLAWGLKRFPARRTALVFWNHGYGWQGYGGDESHEEDMLSLPEMAAALRAGLKRAGLERLDFIGFDCCLMGSLEVMSACRPFGRVMVASEELAPLEGWNYDAMLRAMAREPGMTAPALAKTICASYQDFYEKHADADVREQAAWTTLAAVDLDKVADVGRALDALAARLADGLKDRKGWLALAKGRRSTEEHGQDEDPVESGYLYDLHHLARNLVGLGADAECAALQRAIDSAVLFRVAGADHPESRGIAAYFPPEEELWDEEYRAASCSAPWLKLVVAFLKSGAADREPPVLSKLAMSDGVATAKVLGDDVAETYFFFGGKDGIVGMVPAELRDGTLRAPFDGTWTAVGDAKNRIVMPVGSYERLKDGKCRFEVPAQYRAPDGKEWKNVTLKFNESGKFAGAVMTSAMGPSVLKIRSGSKLRPFAVEIAESNRIVRSPNEDAPVLTVGAEGIGIVRAALPKGTARVGFIAVDHSGNAAAVETEIEVGK
ncbi:MAG: hypothetical protein HYY17_17125 [Planctomycetes bacterium]|nr:hypothetical protein [Planctomycetota bacterium]